MNKKILWGFNIMILVWLNNTYTSSFVQEYITQPTQNFMRYAGDKASQALTGTGNYILDRLPQSFKDKINSLSTETKFLMLTAILSSLIFLGYNKDVISNKISAILTDLEKAHASGLVLRGPRGASSRLLFPYSFPIKITK